MSHMARSEIYYGEQISLEDIAEGVRAVLYTDVVDLAKLLFESAGTTVTLLGDLSEDHVSAIDIN